MSNQLTTVDAKGDTSTQSVSVPILGYYGGDGHSNLHTLGLRLSRLILVAHPHHFVRAVVESVAGDTKAERWSSDINTGEVPPPGLQSLSCFLASGCRHPSPNDIIACRKHLVSAEHGSGDDAF